MEIKAFATEPRTPIRRACDDDEIVLEHESITSTNHEADDEQLHAVPQSSPIPIQLIQDRSRERTETETPMPQRLTAHTIETSPTPAGMAATETQTTNFTDLNRRLNGMQRPEEISQDGTYAAGSQADTPANTKAKVVYDGNMADRGTTSTRIRCPCAFTGEEGHMVSKSPRIEIENIVDRTD